MRTAVVLVLIGLIAAACGEWRTYYLKNPTTGTETACYSSWGPSISAEFLHNLHDCIVECEAHGYKLEHPEDVPPEPEPARVPRTNKWTQCENPT